MTTTKHLLVVSMFVSGTSLFTCFGMQSLTSPKEFVQKIQEFQKYGISEQEIIRVLKENMQQNRQPLRKITDDFGNTVLHMSCEKGDIGTTKIILEALDDDETKALLIQHNQYVHLHSHQDTALTLATHSKNYDVALFLMRYIEKRFGRDFTKKMILECNYYGSNAANTSFTLENVDLVRSILGYLKDQDFKTVMETKNQFETSLLDRVQKIDSCPIAIQIHVCLIYQELYGMSNKEVLKLIFRCQWEYFVEDLAKAKEEQVVKA